jgi:uncharacterized protein YaiE (UPF0345 family)
MQLNNSGNLGLGVTPSAWAGKALQIGIYSGYGTDGNGYSFMANNAYNDNLSSYRYSANSLGATLYRQTFGSHAWFIAPSGTAGNEISFTQAMTLDASGRLGIGLTSMLGRLHIKSSGFSSYPLLVQRNANTNNIFYIIEDADGDGILNLENSGGNANVQLHSNGVSYFNGGNLGIGITAPNSLLEVNKTITFSSIDTYAQLVVKTTSGANGRLLNIGVDETNNVSFIQSLNRGTDAMPLSLQRYGGNVGIGTTSPNGKLDVANAGDVSIWATATSAGSASLYLYPTGGGLAEIGAIGAVNMKFTTNSAERMRITSGGEVLIGGTTDYGDYKLQVNGNIYAKLSQGAVQTWSNSGNSSVNIRTNTGYNSILSFTEEAVSDRWSIGTKSADANLYFSTGDALSAIKFTLSNTGAATFSSSVTSSELIVNNSTPKITLTPLVYSGSYKTVLGARNSAEGVLQLGNNGNNYIVAGNTATGGALNFYVNAISDFITSINGTLALTLASSGAATFSSSVTNTFLNIGSSNGQMGSINSSNANGGYITWETSGTTIADIGTAQQIFGSGGNDTFGINGRGSRAIVFGTNNTERMRITSAGNVEINTGSIKTGEPDTGWGRAAIKIGASVSGAAFDVTRYLPVSVDGTVYYINLNSSTP